MTLAFEDVNSKLLDAVSVADVDAKKYVKAVFRDFEAEFMSGF